MNAAELLLEEQLRQAHIPYEREVPFAKAWGRKWRADFGVSHPGIHKLATEFLGGWKPSLLIEVEGGAYVQGRHTRGASFERDCEKYAAAAILGYRVIRVTPRQVESGQALSWIRQAVGLEQAA